tara:strand:+ start:310 stop:939 length:630 start_codon:yes stop_codon:yes gene_type:complete
MFSIGVPPGVRSPQISGSACATQTQEKYCICIPKIKYSIPNSLNSEYIEPPVDAGLLYLTGKLYDSIQDCETDIQRFIQENSDKSFTDFMGHIDDRRTQGGFEIEPQQLFNEDEKISNMFSVAFDELTCVLERKFGGNIVIFGRFRLSPDTIIIENFTDLNQYIRTRIIGLMIARIGQFRNKHYIDRADPIVYFREHMRELIGYQRLRL